MIDNERMLTERAKAEMYRAKEGPHVKLLGPLDASLSQGHYPGGSAQCPCPEFNWRFHYVE